MKSLIFSLFVLTLLIVGGCSDPEPGSITGGWNATQQNSTYLARRIEFKDDLTVKLEDNLQVRTGNFSISGDIITFAIGDGPPFDMKFRLDGNNLHLNNLNDPNWQTYQKE